MEKIVLTIGGLFSSFTWGDLFFFVVTLFLMLFLIYIIYLVKLDNSDIIIVKPPKQKAEIGTLNEKNEPEDKPLTKIVNELETDYKPAPIDLTDYEKELEDTAIISYDELVNRTSNNIYYDDNYESGFDDILVQKVDNKKSNTQELVNLPTAVMMSYESEEAFLSALKVLQKNLVR